MSSSPAIRFVSSSNDGDPPPELTADFEIVSPVTYDLAMRRRDAEAQAKAANNAALADAKRSLTNPELFGLAAQAAAKQVSKMCVRLGCGDKPAASAVFDPQKGWVVVTAEDTGIQIQRAMGIYFRVETVDRSPA